MAKHLVLFTMEGCPHCVDFKKILKEDGLNFIDMDINKYPEEYGMFSKITENEYVPAFMIVDDQTNLVEYFAPDRDYQDLNEAINLIKLRL
jgi:glutaredoxin